MSSSWASPWLAALTFLQGHVPKVPLCPNPLDMWAAGVCGSLPFCSLALRDPSMRGSKAQTIRAEPLTQTCFPKDSASSLSSQGELPRQGHPRASLASCYLPVKGG